MSERFMIDLGQKNKGRSEIREAGAPPQPHGQDKKRGKG